MGIRRLIIYLIPLLFILSCNQKPKKRLIVGFAQCFSADDWRDKMVLDMQTEIIAYPELRLVIKNADEDPELQAEQIRDFIKQKVDVLIISPVHSYAITPIAEEAYDAGIPTIILNRKINSSKYTASIGTDNYEIGRNAALYLTAHLSEKQQHTILEITGSQASSPAMERHEGFIDVLKNIPGFTIRQIDGNWRAETTARKVSSLPDLDKISAVYAHNDRMALAAREAIASIDTALVNKIMFLGVDGLPGKGSGIEAVATGKLQASFMYPTGGDIAIQLANRILKGEKVGKDYLLTSSILGKDNANILYIQTNKLSDYQKQIDNLQKRLGYLSEKYSFFRNSLVIFAILLVVLAAASFYIYYISRKIFRKNKELKQAYEKVEQQKEELSDANRRINEVTAQKLQFFTNVSHEVKTPLTLILGPVNKILQDTAIDSRLAEDLHIVRKNVLRLKRVIEQLLDFRKIEDNRMTMRVCQFDLIKVVEDSMSYFRNMATDNQINYTFVYDGPKELPFWGDADKVEKILVNLLSNAFKFTPRKGRITVSLKQENMWITLSVEDNGKGILPENLSEIFERFFTGNQSYAPGTGLGLHLAREFVQMHKGHISVQSEQNVRTVFTVELPNDKSIYEHYPEYTPSISDDISKISVLPLSKEQLLTDEKVQEVITKNYPYTLLVVEDDADIRNYIVNELSRNFTVIAIENGKKALQVLQEDSISLVISDILMPEMNGFELCRQVKSNVLYSHIPVILLTALSDREQQMYGYVEGADDYIKKPFDINYLKLRIVKLIETRIHLREQLFKEMESLRYSIDSEETLKKAESTDELFMRKFIDLIEQNYHDSEFSIEKGSGELGFSRVHLYRKVKDLFNTTPIDFLRNYRLKVATKLLQEKNHTISEIAYSTGFSSPAYFSKCFKSLYGITPTEYLDKFNAKEGNR